MADAAASAHPDARRPEPLVNIVVDEDTLTEHLDRATSGRCDRFRPRPGAVCRLADGTPLDPAAAVTAALQGAVRRVVVDSAGVIVAAGTERRLFTGPIRDLLLTQVPECTWPGCHVRVRHCQIDHATEWHQGGRTDPANANLLCGRHSHPEKPPTATASTETPTASGTPSDPTAPKYADPHPRLDGSTPDRRPTRWPGRARAHSVMEIASCPGRIAPTLTR